MYEHPAQLGRKLSGKQPPAPSLFDPPHYDEPSDDEPVLVRLRNIRLERLRDFGDVWMALGLWRLLGLDTLLEKLAPGGREEVPWPVVAAVLTIARFCEPQSELHIESTWYRRTALEDLLGVPVDKMHTDRLYSGMDWLLPLKPGGSTMSHSLFDESAPLSVPPPALVSSKESTLLVPFFTSPKSSIVTLAASTGVCVDAAGSTVTGPMNPLLFASFFSVTRPVQSAVASMYLAPRSVPLNT
jgi:hypothetical protein